jgi:hypothetical protein
MIGAILTAAFELAGEIVEAIVDKGDDADDIRLKDLAGWSKLKKSCRQKDALNRFRRLWKERDNKPEE